MDYYQILGVSRNASPQEIKKAYKKKAMEHHPDRGGDHNKFAEINSAYETLSNADKKAAYDNPQPQFNYNARDFSGGNPFAGTPFDHIFGQGFAQQRTPKNRDITIAATIELEDVIRGKSLVVQYRLQSGKLETVNVDIPPGANAGDTVRFQGLGDDGHKQFPRGDLNVRIQVNKRKNWERDGQNLITNKSINVFDLLLGCVIIVNTLDGRKVKLNIPKGTKHGQVFSIPQYGIPNINTGKKGNLYVSIEADVPTIEEENILQSIAVIRNQVYTD
jgi:curved DNA-binding protein